MEPVTWYIGYNGIYVDLTVLQVLITVIAFEFSRLHFDGYDSSWTATITMLRLSRCYDIPGDGIDQDCEDKSCSSTPCPILVRKTKYGDATFPSKILRL